jgi:hypothetical protein
VRGRRLLRPAVQYGRIRKQTAATTHRRTILPCCNRHFHLRRLKSSAPRALGITAATFERFELHQILDAEDPADFELRPIVRPEATRMLEGEEPELAVLRRVPLTVLESDEDNIALPFEALFAARSAVFGSILVGQPGQLAR